MEIIRDSTTGAVLNTLFGLFPYPEEKPGYQLPERYLKSTSNQVTRAPSLTTPPAEPKAEAFTHEKGNAKDEFKSNVDDPESGLAVGEKPSKVDSEADRQSRISNLTVNVNKEYILVEWDGPNDPDNPRYVAHIYAIQFVRS